MKLNISNINENTLNNNVVYEEQEESYSDIILLPFIRKYIFFSLPNKKGIEEKRKYGADIFLNEIENNQYRIWLDWNLYGFPDEHEVVLDKRKMNLKIEKYQTLTNLVKSLPFGERMKTNVLLKRIRNDANSRLEYDIETSNALEHVFEKEETRRIELLPDSYSRKEDYMKLTKARDEFDEADMILRNKFALCSEGGNVLRTLLGSLNLDLFYAYSSAKIMGVRLGRFVCLPHDVTAVFDKSSGKWTVLNSLSASLNYDVLPLEITKEIMLY